MPTQSSNKPEFFTLDQFKGLNQQNMRPTIDDQEEFWDENLFAIGPGNMRSLWGPSAPIYTAPSGTQILRIFFGFYGNQTPEYNMPGPMYWFGVPGPIIPGAMGWMFLSDGTIDEVDLNTHQVTGLRAATQNNSLGSGRAWVPWPPMYWASAKVWRPKFYGAAAPAPAGQNGGVLFGSPYGLFAWDGTTLYCPGDPAPDWLTNLAETNPSAPIPPMPSGLPAVYAMEVYASRLWIAGKDVISFSAPSNGADFSTASGGGSFGYFGDRLVCSYMDLAATAGLLYCFGDSSVDYINNVTLIGNGTVGSPYETNFNYVNVDPQAGQAYPRPVGRLGRYFTAFNGAGIYRLRGGEFLPIDDKVTNLYLTLDNSLYFPTFAPATLFGYRVMLVNGRFHDPYGHTRNLLLVFHDREGNEFWSVASQGVELTNIGAYDQNSNLVPYGTDGTNLYQLFAQPDPKLIKKYASKVIRGSDPETMLTLKNYKYFASEVWDNSGQGVSITGTASTSGGGVPGGVQAIGAEVQPGARLGINAQPLQGMGLGIAIDWQSHSPDFTCERFHIAWEQRTPWLP